MPHAVSTRPAPHDSPLERTADSQPALLHEFFQRAARTWPNRVAVETPPSRTQPCRRHVSYAELDQHTDALAGYLREYVTRECVVAVLLPRDCERVYLAQIAALKAGAAYCCIDPTFPDSQIAAILDDAQPVAVLTDADGAARLRRVAYECSPPLLDVVEWLAHAGGTVEPPPPAAWLSERSLAYVIYTSGTTGRPKGVMIEHGAIANLVRGSRGTFPTTPDDRVGQNSSCAYDSSVDEIWMALANGAALVVMDDDTTRLGPDLIPWLRRERVSVFSPPPTMLRTTGSAAPLSVLPDLKRLHVGGEQLTDDVVERWAPGRCFVNDYGPTECSVVALRAVVEPGEPITIGRPVPGIQAYVLDERLEEVPAGQTGELCLAGAGLARGYLNDPVMTARKFPAHPRLGRIYRTGDLAHRDADGNFFCHGRIDAQVKVRGYRIELEAIESALAECPGVLEAACRVQGEGGDRLIAAFVVPADNGRPPSFDTLKAYLRAALPAYAVPSRFGLLARLPKTVSGKLNRRDLPVIETPQEDEAATRPVVAPRTPIEEKIAAAFRTALQMREVVSVGHDFFHDLGGDSLRAAMTISLLRDDPTTEALTVRDLYEARSVAGLAKKVTAGAPVAAPLAAASEPHQARPLVATLLQTVWLLLTFVFGGPIVYLMAFEVAPWVTESLGLAASLLLAPMLFLGGLALYALVTASFAVLVKKVLIGKYRPLRAPVWGSFFVRNWMVQQAVRLVPWRLLEGTVFQHSVLRALGARIGKRVHVHRGVNLYLGGWDLLELGDDVSVGQDAALRLVDLENGEIVVGPVTLGAGATLEVRAGVAGNTRLGENAYLTALSLLPPGVSVPRGECWGGIPATRLGPAPQTPTPAAGVTLSPLWHGAAMLLGRFAVETLTSLPLALVALTFSLVWGVSAHDAVERFLHPSLSAGEIVVGTLLLVLSVPARLLSQCLVLRALGRVREGVINRWSLAYVRVWLKTGVVSSANDWLSGTLLWRVWLRAAGMRIGRNSEVGTIIDTVPELVSIGSETFFADGVYLAGPRVHRGTVTLAPVSMGDRDFLGNHAIVPGGRSLPGGVLVGISTVADESMDRRPGASWFGHPPFELPKREIVECDRSLTHEPSWPRYLSRVCWELLRFTLPVVPAFLVLGWFAAMAFFEALVSLPVLLLAVVPALDLAFFGCLCLLVLALKWLLLGRVKPGTHPLWSCWCSRWDFHFVTWEMYAHAALTMLEGTLLLNVYLRLMGVRIGKNVVLGPGFAHVVDPDMLSFADGSTVSSLFQAHTFEDRVLKIDYVTVGRGATVGTAAVLLYGADVRDGAWVVAHSVVMKRERLMAHHAYVGHPTRLLFQGQGQQGDPHEAVQGC
jgi:non-ribosomal peptide synthetase-like protein